MPSKNIFKYFMCWADWSMKGKSEVTPPTPNSSQFNFSPSEKSESWGKALETSDTRHKDTLKGAWSEEVADVHSWINRCLKGVPAQGSSSARVGHRNTNTARWVQLGRDGGVLRRPWWREPWPCTGMCSGHPDGENPEPALSAAAQSKGSFLTLISKMMPVLQPKLFPQLPCIHSSESQLCGFSIWVFPQETAAFDHFTAMLWVKWKPSVNISMGATSRSLISAEYSSSMRSTAALSQQTVNNNQEKPHKCCNKYLVL